MNLYHSHFLVGVAVAATLMRAKQPTPLEVHVAKVIGSLMLVSVSV
jgi:hypothetical protein